MIKHPRRLAMLSALAMASACDRVVELYTLDSGPFVPPSIDARVIDARSPPPADAPVSVDAGVSVDGRFGTDAAVVIDAPFAVPPADPTTVRTRT